MSIYDDKLLLVEGSGYFSWDSSPIPGVAAFVLEIQSPMPPGIAVTISSGKLHFFGTPPIGCTGNWPVRLAIIDSLLSVVDLLFPIVFSPAQAAFQAIVDDPSVAQNAFYYALCGGPLCQESTYGQ
jgi:hypothetical protein